MNYAVEKLIGHEVWVCDLFGQTTSSIATTLVHSAMAA